MNYIIYFRMISNFKSWRSSMEEQLICNQRVVGSTPIASSKEREKFVGRFQSGQMGRAVNPLPQGFGGSNPSLPIDDFREIIIERE